MEPQRMRTLLLAIAFVCGAGPALPQSVSLPQLSGLNGYAEYSQLGPWQHGFTHGLGFETFTTLKKTTAHSWGAQLAIGYDNLPFRSGKIGDKYQINGEVRTLPSFTVYASRYLVPSGRIGVYVGAGTGLVQLKNVTAYDTKRRPYAISADTWTAHPAVGLFFKVGKADSPSGEPNLNLELFVEYSHPVRTFSTLTYTLPKTLTLPDGKTPDDSLPADLPTSISTGGHVVSVGFSFSIPEKAAAKTDTKARTKDDPIAEDQLTVPAQHSVRIKVIAQAEPGLSSPGRPCAPTIIPENLAARVPPGEPEPQADEVFIPSETSARVYRLHGQYRTDCATHASQQPVKPTRAEAYPLRIRDEALGGTGRVVTINYYADASAAAASEPKPIMIVVAEIIPDTIPALSSRAVPGGARSDSRN
jgi:hypothetical protein